MKHSQTTTVTINYAQSFFLIDLSNGLDQRMHTDKQFMTDFSNGYTPGYLLTSIVP